MRKRFRILPAALCLAALWPALAADDAYRALPVKAVLFPMREAVLSSRIDGVIIRYRFAPGERFKEGEPLLELDRQERENQFKRAAAALKEGRGNLDFARKQLEDFSVLFKESLQSELEVKRKELELQIAESRFDTAEAERDNAALQLTYCTLKAPFAGRVEKILTREFETVRNGQPILSIIDDNRLLAVLHLPSADLPKIGLEDPVRLRINETGTVASGVVHEIAARADHRSETFEIKALIDNADHILTAGMSGVLQEISKDAGE